jgi:hypothetical protein
MAYKVDPPNTDPPDSTAGGPVTMTDIENFFSGNESPEFYELETAEVKEIYLDEEDLPLNKDGDPDWSRYGWAMVRLSVSAKSLTDVIEARPLDSNIKQYPLPGEFVIVAENYFKEYYYIQKINSNSSVNFNFLPGFSTHHVGSNIGTNPNIKDFKPDGRIRQLQAEEGDITFNGRFGQSIRFGSNIVNLGGNKYGPNILMRAGQGELPTIKDKPVNEDINLDGSSIWITTDQRVKLHLKGTKSFMGPSPGIWPFYHMYEVGTTKISEADDVGFGGKQIILNSDRLIFNTNKNSILMSSPSMIGLSATKEIGLEVPKDSGRVMLGDAGTKRKSHTSPEDIMGIEPVLGGDQTMKLFSQLIDAINSFAGVLSSAVAGPGLPWAPTTLTPINAASSELKASLVALKKRLDEPKSRTVFVGHIKGPSPFAPPKRRKEPNREQETAAWIKKAREDSMVWVDGQPKRYDEFITIIGEGGVAAGHPGIHIEKLEDPKVPSGYKPVGFTEHIMHTSSPGVAHEITYTSGIMGEEGATVIVSHTDIEVTTFHDHIMSLYVEKDDGLPSWPN